MFIYVDYPTDVSSLWQVEITYPQHVSLEFEANCTVIGSTQ